MSFVGRFVLFRSVHYRRFTVPSTQPVIMYLIYLTLFLLKHCPTIRKKKSLSFPFCPPSPSLLPIILTPRALHHFGPSPFVHPFVILAPPPLSIHFCHFGPSPFVHPFLSFPLAINICHSLWPSISVILAPLPLSIHLSFPLCLSISVIPFGHPFLSFWPLPLCPSILTLFTFLLCLSLCRTFRRDESRDMLTGKPNGTFLVRPKVQGGGVEPHITTPTHSHTIDIV